MDVNELWHKKTFTLLLAPPGWGKTTMLLDLYERVERKIVFVSPLRAIAQEFFLKAKKMKGVEQIKSAQFDQSFKKFSSKNKGMWIITPESLRTGQLDQLLNGPPLLFVFDEFHLFYYWGDSFRPYLWEFCLNIANSEHALLALTATMSDKLLYRWRADFSLGVDHLNLINLGNMQLKFTPRRLWNYRLLGKKALLRRFWFELRRSKTEETFLIFCHYREEVEQWLRILWSQGFYALGCIGGQAEQFCLKLENLNRSPKVIVATSVLSHGVNLPPISYVFISYPVQQQEFWLQMLARGGRAGNPYQVFCLNSFKRDHWWQLLWACCLDLLLRARL